MPRRGTSQLKLKKRSRSADNPVLKHPAFYLFMLRQRLPRTTAPHLAVALKHACAAIALMGGALGTAWAQVYVGQTANGGVSLSYAPSSSTPDLLVEAPPAPPVVESVVMAPAAHEVANTKAALGPVPHLPEQYRSMIHAAARSQKVSPALVAAVAAAESSFNTSARSPKGAVGMMQLMPDTARRFSVNNRLSAEESVRGGAAYLRWLSDHFGQDLEKTIAAYNAGEHAVERAGGIPPYAETRAYVPRVMHYLQHYTELLKASNIPS